MLVQADQVRHTGSMGTAEQDQRSHRERMVAGDPYITDPEIAGMQAGRAALNAAFNAADPGDEEGCRAALTALVGSLGEGTFVRAPLAVDYGSNLHLGARVFANFGLVALDVAPIRIGDDVQIGPNVQLLTPTHPLEAEARRAKWESAAPITIGDNVWLGGGVIVLAGVSIGPDTVVGAGAVVTKDLPAGVLAVGNPARVVREL